MGASATTQSFLECILTILIIYLTLLGITQNLISLSQLFKLQQHKHKIHSTSQEVRDSNHAHIPHSKHTNIIDQKAIIYYNKNNEESLASYLLRIAALVGMILDGSFFISLLQVLSGSVLGHPQDLIVPRIIALLRCSSKHLVLSFLTGIHRNETDPEKSLSRGERYRRAPRSQRNITWFTT